ncbi:MAG: thioesterase family protein [Nitrospirota bacterium]
MSMIETYRGVVYPGQLDHMDHMNVQWYASKFDEATWQLFSAIGITSEYIREQNKGMAALEQITKYKSEVRSGELLVVKSKVIETSKKTIKFLHIMYNVESKQEVANTELVGIHIDMKIRKSCPLPAGVVEKCSELFNITT